MHMGPHAAAALTSMGSFSSVTRRVPAAWLSTVTLLLVATISIAGMAPTKLYRPCWSPFTTDSSRKLGALTSFSLTRQR